MNKRISRIGSTIVAVSVLLFAIFMLIPFDFGSFVACMFLPIGYIIMSAGILNESENNRRVSALTGFAFAIIYAVLIFLVYFAQTTTVKNESLTIQANGLLNYANGGLMFNYDLLGYGMMALSTFFLGLSMNAKTKSDKWLKYLLIIHGIFFPCCLIMPMTGVIASSTTGDSKIYGVILLEFWCAYFLPIGILSYRHFKGKK